MIILAQSHELSGPYSQFDKEQDLLNGTFVTSLSIIKCASTTNSYFVEEITHPLRKETKCLQLKK